METLFIFPSCSVMFYNDLCFWKIIQTTIASYIYINVPKKVKWCLFGLLNAVLKRMSTILMQF